MNKTSVQTDPIFRDAFYNFSTGAEAVLYEVPVVLAIGASSLLLALCQQTDWLKVCPYFLVGTALGSILGALAVVPPILPVYFATLTAALAAAISLRISPLLVNLTITAMAMFMANAILNGYPWKLIPQVTYLGIAIALFSSVAIVYWTVRTSLKLLPYPWVSIAWRATASWIATAAILLIALRLSNPPSGIEHWFDNWVNS